MLILSRRVGQKIVIGKTTITVTRIDGDQVKLGFDAPAAVRIYRGELLRGTHHNGNQHDAGD